jgi:predicted DNA-binding protein YlxM (UPF0122 family)
MRGKPLSDDLVHAIYMKRDRGLSLRAIANTLEISLGAVHNVLKRRVPNQLEQKKAKLGPRRITNAITDAKMVLAMKRRRFQSNSKLANDFGVSTETFRRRGKEVKTYNVSSFLTGVCSLCAALYIRNAYFIALLHAFFSLFPMQIHELKFYKADKLKDTIRSVMHRLFSDELLGKFNRTGSNGKISFSEVAEDLIKSEYV